VRTIATFVVVRPRSRGTGLFEGFPERAGARGENVQEQSVDIYNAPAVVVVVYSSCERASRRVVVLMMQLSKA
jgi:hypothetical protein